MLPGTIVYGERQGHQLSGALRSPRRNPLAAAAGSLALVLAALPQ